MMVLYQERVVSALWAFFAGDALASPTHWFYGGLPQIQRIYATSITGYTKPVTELPGSILNKSNLSGGGRSSSQSSKQRETVVGNVINHCKAPLWSPGKSIHYHATLASGEPTLEAQLARVLMKSIVSNQGHLNTDHFRQAYVDFMTNPGSHNDTYASTCHRMFFANWYYDKLPARDCPDNDSHNVDTIDGLVLPTIAALAAALRSTSSADDAARDAATVVAVTRRSEILEAYASAWGHVVHAAVTAPPTTVAVLQRMAKQLGLPAPRPDGSARMTACYLSSAVPSLLDMIYKHHASSSSSVWETLLENANCGGENVHRGSCLGAIVGATAAAATESQLVDGLYNREELSTEIQAFVQAAISSAPASPRTEL